MSERLAGVEWKTIPLSEIAAEFVNGGTPSTRVPEYWSGNIPWITAADIKNLRVSEGRKKITDDAIRGSSTHLVAENTVLLVTRTSVGKVGLSANPLCFSQDITAIKCKPLVRPDYLARYLSSIQGQLVSKVRGSTIKGLARQDFTDIEVPIPPLETQEKIANILDRAEWLKLRREQVNQMTNKILQAVFLQMFGDPATNPKGWEFKTLEDITEFSQYGLTARSSKSGKYLLLRITDINDEGEIIVSDPAFVNVPEHIAEKYILLEGDLVFARTGATVGKTHMFSGFSDKPVIFASYLIRFRPDKKIINPRYLFRFTKTDYYRTFVKNSMKTVAQPNINSRQYSDLEVPVPPLSIQDKFASLVERLAALKQRQRRTTKEMAQLFNSLMSRAFSGELVLDAPEITEPHQTSAKPPTLTDYMKT